MDLNELLNEVKAEEAEVRDLYTSKAINAHAYTSTRSKLILTEVALSIYIDHCDRERERDIENKEKFKKLSTGLVGAFADTNRLPEGDGKPDGDGVADTAKPE